MNKNPFLLLLFVLCLGFVSCSDDDEPCTPQNFFADADGDGEGDAANFIEDCVAPAGFVDNDLDPDDNNATFRSVNFWTGPRITVTKADNADWTLAENQDRITDNVWITRQNNQFLFNIVNESTYDGGCGSLLPSDTEWALGTIADGVDTLTFQPAIQSNFWDCSPPSAVGMNAVLHLISDDIYIDFTLLSWTNNNGGGGFSYERSTPSVPQA